MKIVLYQPQIPQNTGNIARTCAATNTGLVLVHPLGFSISDRQMKRAGLDYWDRVALETVEDLPAYLEREGVPFFFFSSKATRLHTEAEYTRDSLLIFGSETTGLSPLLWERYPERFFRIPMVDGHRCLNLGSSAAIALYEALRQTEFQSFVAREKGTEQRECSANNR